MLIVELDGSQHNAPDNLKTDETRTQHLTALGYRVVRAWNSEISNIDGVLTSIYLIAAERMSARPPTSQSSPGTGEEGAARPIGIDATGEGLGAKLKR
jgi:hypothetical protein